MQIDVVSDIVCPWCYLGKRRLEEALAQAPDIHFEVSWRPYQLDPSIPPGGVERKAYMQAKFGDLSRLSAASSHLKELGAAAGINFRFDAIARTPNTLDGHRLLRWSAGVGVQDKLVEALFRAYFIEGRDVGDPQTLTEIAGICGMDADLVSTLLAGDADRDFVQREVRLAQELGITGVPAFLIDNRFMIVGAQDASVLLRAIRKAEADRGAKAPADQAASANSAN